jgi:hypothetical protein
MNLNSVQKGQGKNHAAEYSPLENKNLRTDLIRTLESSVKQYCANLLPGFLNTDTIAFEDIQWFEEYWQKRRKEILDCCKAEEIQ